MDISLIPAKLAQWAERKPAATALVFLDEGEHESRRLSYAQLHAQCCGAAQALRDRLGAGERALLLYPQGIDFIITFFGCLYAGVVPVPVSAPEVRAVQRSLKRMSQVVADADPRIILTTHAMRHHAAGAVAEITAFAGRDWLATDGLDACDSFVFRCGGPGSLAYLQYTSGSTSAPKGVEITHANILHNLDVINHVAQPREGDVMVSWLPQFHDFGLVYGTMWPIYNGLPAYLMTPADFVGHPARWLQAISKYRGTHSGGANFAFDLCTRKVDDPTLHQLDLHSWRVVINGAEPIRKSSIEGFIQKFAAAGFARETMRPTYGMAETTLIVTSLPPGQTYRTLTIDRQAFEHNHQITPCSPLEGGRGMSAGTPSPSGGTPYSASDPRASNPAPHPTPDSSPTTDLVACGAILPGNEIAIVDPATHLRQPDASIGEVWMRGGSIAAGYFNNAAATEETFGAQITGEGDARYLRSGDYGFLHDGQLYITGRLKDLIIIRGANYYPQDIEETAYTSHPAFRPGCASAFAMEHDGEEQLVVVLEVARAEDAPEQLVAAVREAVVREHGIQAAGVVLLPQGALPKTTSGKIQRGPCRDALLKGELSPLFMDMPSAADMHMQPPTPHPADAPHDEAQILDWLRERLAGVLAIPLWKCNADHSVLDLGLDSLKAMDLLGQMRDAFGVRIEPAELFDAVTPRAIVALLLQRRTEGAAPDMDEAATEYEEGTL